MVLHEILDSFMDPGRTHVVVGPSFRPVHRAYLWVSTAQWLTCLALAWWTLRAWTAEVRIHHRVTESTEKDNTEQG